jgi:DNA recombination protein RmuC
MGSVAIVIAVVVTVLAGCAATALLVSRVVTVQLRAHAASERDATVRAALESTVGMADQQLGLRNDAIGQQLTGMGTELRRVGDLVTMLQRDRAEQHGQVVAGLEQALRTTTELATTTQALRHALASPKARGQWGERMADDVLRTAGMIDGINYTKQSATATGTVPDFTFLLPRGQQLHMDVKFPVDNYLRHLEAATDAERDASRTAFLRDVRNRVRELAARGYADPATTVGYLLLFIPNESVYSFIHEHDRDLPDIALGQKVVLCSPFTLFAVLGIVRQSVDTFHLQRASDEILGALGRFTDQWDRFSEHIDKLGKQLGTAVGTFDDLAGTRRRQLEKRLDEIEAIRTRRGLPDDGGGSGQPPVLRDVSSL